VSWRAFLDQKGYGVHPAAETFEMLPAAELAELAKDIDEHGLRSPLAFWRKSETDRWELLDGRNRVAAMFGLIEGDALVEGAIGVANFYEPHHDPRAFVWSANALRRHLSVEQKRNSAAKLLIANPAVSDRAIAKTTQASPTFVGQVRRNLEQRGMVSTVDTRVGRDGVAQPAHKPATTPRQPAPPPAARPLLPPPRPESKEEWLRRQREGQVRPAAAPGLSVLERIEAGVARCVADQDAAAEPKAERLRLLVKIMSALDLTGEDIAAYLAGNASQ
jgi:hypothetical protein